MSSTHAFPHCSILSNHETPLKLNSSRAELAMEITSPPSLHLAETHYMQNAAHNLSQNPPLLNPTTNSLPISHTNTHALSDSNSLIPHLFSCIPLRLKMNKVNLLIHKKIHLSSIHHPTRLPTTDNPPAPSLLAQNPLLYTTQPVYPLHQPKSWIKKALQGHATLF